MRATDPPAPEPPEWLSADARAVWDNLDADRRTGVDPDALGVYCSAVVDYTKAQAVIDAHGPIVKGRDSTLVRNPAHIVKAENAALIRQLGRQLGIVGKPSARPVPEVVGYRNQAAIEHTIAALRSGGRLEAVDAAAAALARHLARALDLVDASRYPAQTASLARVQLATLRTLRGIDDEVPSSVDDILAYLSAPLGDAPQP
jgi:P27 family predicted phage terminase small subunit